MMFHGQVWCVPELAGFGCFGGCIFPFFMSVFLVMGRCTF